LAKQFEDLGTNLNAMVDENRPDIKEITGEIHRLAQGFKSTGDDLRDVMARLNKGEGTLGKLLTDDAVIAKLETGIDSLNDMLTGFKKMDLTLDMGASYWERRGDGRAGVGLVLAPRDDYWYTIEVATTPDGRLRDETQTATRLDPITGQTVEVPTTIRTVKTQQTFTASAQFNKRVGNNFVVHAGIIDGTGGGGAEFRALGDKLRVGALAYDFSKRDGKENPRFRATASYEFWNGVYAQTGVQDVANKDSRTFFFGSGVRWKDDDLKKLVGLAGVASN
jgi:phospholipid/cholesterol/gamma-HCH transport system substrate-binding protein